MPSSLVATTPRTFLQFFFTYLVKQWPGFSSRELKDVHNEAQTGLISTVI